VQARSTIELDPGFYPAHLFLGLAYQQAGRRSDAIAALERAISLSQRSTMTLAALAAALAADAQTSRVSDLLGELDHAAARGRYVSRVWLAAVHAALGDTDRALDSLERARRDRCCWLLRCVRLDARFDTLRDIPRFQTLLRTDV